jgi:hypothetical protein
MKIIFVLIPFVFLCCMTNRKENQIHEDCVLLELTKIREASCGGFSFWVGMKFKKKKSNEVFIGFVNCPELYGTNFFATGRVYEVVGEKPFKKPPSDLVHDEYANTGLPTYKIQELKLK